MTAEAKASFSNERTEKILFSTNEQTDITPKTSVFAADY